MNYKTVQTPAQKVIALVAHDNLKSSLIDWCKKHEAALAQHHICATGTSGQLIEKHCDLKIEKLISGPLGGDQQIGAKISEGEVDMLVFFWDPFEPMPHDPDVKALLRIAAVWNIPVACNFASADMMMASNLLDQSFAKRIPDYESYIQQRGQ